MFWSWSILHIQCERAAGGILIVPASFVEKKSDWLHIGYLSSKLTSVVGGFVLFLIYYTIPTDVYEC